MKKTKVLIQKDICIRVNVTLFSIDKIWKQPKYSLTDAWIKMYVRTYIYTH